MRPASAKKRFVNSILDYFIFPIIAIIALALLYEARLINDELSGLLAIVSMFQVIILEKMIGQSFGKLITGTIVISKDGNKPSLVQIIIRNLARFIPFEVLSFLSANPIGWHDALSGTIVVDKDLIHQKK